MYNPAHVQTRNLHFSTLTPRTHARKHARTRTAPHRTPYITTPHLASPRLAHRSAVAKSTLSPVWASGSDGDGDGESSFSIPVRSIYDRLQVIVEDDDLKHGKGRRTIGTYEVKVAMFFNKGVEPITCTLTSDAATGERGGGGGGGGGGGMVGESKEGGDASRGAMHYTMLRYVTLCYAMLRLLTVA